MALIPLADYRPETSSGATRRPSNGAMPAASGPRLRPLSEYAAESVPVNRPAASLASRIAALTGQAGSLFSRGASMLPKDSGLRTSLTNLSNVADIAGGAMRIGTSVGGDGSTASRVMGSVAGAAQLYNGVMGMTGGTSLPADLTSGAMRIGTALGGDGSPASRVAGGAAGAAQLYNGVAGMTGMTPMPWYVGPVLDAGVAASESKSAGEAAARAGVSALQSGVSYMYGPLGHMFGPMMDGIGRAVTRAFTDVPHDVREQAETQRALGKAETMMAEVGTATTPEELWRALNRGVGTYGVPLDARYRTVDDLLANPAAYAAAIQAGVDPDFIAGTNARLTQTVQQTVALMNAARAGDPQAQAILAARTPQRDGYLAKAIALMSGPTLRGSNDEGGGGAFQTGGGGAPADVWGTLALSGGTRAAPLNLSQSLGGYKAAAISGLPTDLFRKYGVDDLSTAYDAATAHETPVINFTGTTFPERVRSFLTTTDEALMEPPSFADEGGNMIRRTRKSFVPTPGSYNVGDGGDGVGSGGLDG